MTPESTCPSCGRRRGRRSCPALGREICAICCGTKRLIEIACPPECRYLSSARQHPAAVVQRRREREGRFLAAVVNGLTEPQYQLFLLVQMAVVRYAPGAIPALVDRDVAEAARALADTAETAARGIIYEHQTTSLPAQRLLTELKAMLDSLRQSGRGPRESDVTLALRATERAAATAEEELGGERAYVELLAGLFAAAPSEDATGPADEKSKPSGLILP
jgi:hypothetical protein